jgi:hypothetical protein
MARASSPTPRSLRRAPNDRPGEVAANGEPEKARQRRELPNAGRTRTPTPTPLRAPPGIRRLAGLTAVVPSPALTRARARRPIPTRSIQGTVPRTQRKGKKGSSARGPARPRDDVERVIAAFEAVYERPARLSDWRWRGRLERALRRLDRYADFGRGRPGACAELAVRLIADARAEGPGREARSVAYFVPVLDAISKDWRRAQKPRIKAQRRSLQSPPKGVRC